MMCNKLKSIASDDVINIVERIIPFAPRGEMRENVINKFIAEYTEKLLHLNNLANDRLTCPICENADNVIKQGSMKGAKKFICRNYDETDNNKGHLNFSTFTSYDALVVYRDLIVECLTLFCTCGGTYGGIARFMGISTYFVELAMSACVESIGTKAREIDMDEDKVVVFMDFSGTRVSKKVAIIMAKIGDKIFYEFTTVMNSMSAWSFIYELKQSLKIKPDATVIFVTDGEKSFVYPIQSFFPDAIHIRQFHSPASRGIVFVHFKYDDGERYTFRCLWDIVLNEGECSEATKSKRKEREKLKENKQRSDSENSDKKEKTELYDGVILWRGTVMEPRGVRRRKPEKKSNESGGKECNEICSACSNKIKDEYQNQLDKYSLHSLFQLQN